MIAATIVGRAVEMQREVKSGIQGAALIYLKEALANARYEECLELVAIAREAGATEAQIQQAILEAYVASKRREKVSCSQVR